MFAKVITKKLLVFLTRVVEWTLTWGITD